MNVSVITVPFDSGLRDIRMGRGPQAVLDAGLIEHLRAAGLTVQVTTVDAPTTGLPAEIPTTFALLRRVAERVGTARRDGAFPLLLSGNCSSAIGAVAGMRAAGAKAPAVCWFDAHADLNTPETTTSGFLDGMAVSMLTGRCWRSMTDSVAHFAPVPPARVVLIGARDLDEAESKLLRTTPIRRVAAADAVAGIDTALGALGECDEVYLHVDLDVLDPSEGRANAYAAPGGLTLEALCEALRRVAQRIRVGGASLTAYDPAGDPDGRIAAAALRIAALVTTGSRVPR